MKKFKVGDIVRHNSLGHGNVVSTDPLLPFYGIKTQTGLQWWYETELTMAWKKS